MVAGNFIDLIFLFPQVFNFFLLFPFEVIQCFYILFKLGDSQMSFFCIFFGNTPNCLLVNAKIMVRQDIPETGNVRPRNLRMLFAKLAGKVLDGFTQILKFPSNSILTHDLYQEFFLRAGRVKQDVGQSIDC